MKAFPLPILLSVTTSVLAMAMSGPAAFSVQQGPPTAVDTPGLPSKAANDSLAIVGGRLIDGFGGIPLENAVVLIEGPTITRVGQIGQVEVPAEATIIDANGMTVMPGLWESHGHLRHIGAARFAEFEKKFGHQMPAIMAEAAKQTLLAGVTSFRDLGDHIADSGEAVPVAISEELVLRQEIEEGKRPGPRLFLAGPILNQRGKGSGTGTDFFVENPEEAREMVSRLVTMGVDQVKVYGFWDESLLAVLTEAAHRAGLGVDADVRHVEAYRTAVRARVDRLHHVFTADSLSDYSDEDMRLLIRGERPFMSGPSANIPRGSYIVPTIEMRQAYARALQFPGIIDHPRFRDQFPPDLYSYLHATWAGFQTIPYGVGAAERVKVAKQKLRAFIQAGGREQLVAGTDAGSALNFHSPLARELATYVEVGLSPMEAIQSATLRAAQMQGLERTLGTVSPGKLADVIVVDGDPLQQIEVLQYRIAHVIKNGKVYK